MTVTTSIGLRPFGSRILVRREEAPKTSKGGIYLPESKQEKPAEGVVAALGTGLVVRGKDQVEHTFTVSVGDRVVFAKHVGYEIEDQDGEKYLVMEEHQVECLRS